MRILSFLITLACSASYRITTYSRIFHETVLEPIQVFGPSPSITETNKDNVCLLFFTGGNNVIPHYIYSDFIHELAKQNLTIYTPRFNYPEMIKLILQLKKEYKDVIPIGHSSGCSNILNLLDNMDMINRMIFLDPVNTRFTQKHKPQLYTVKNILYLLAEKSFNAKPFPFVPNFFTIDPTSMSLNPSVEITTVKTEKHGHCDILNDEYGNFMHSVKLAQGIEDRSQINEYHQWLSEQIKQFIKRTTPITKPEYGDLYKIEDDYYNIKYHP